MQPLNYANQMLSQCESTNVLVKELGKCGFPHGTWVAARVQTKGHGRHDRAWESLEGNLHLSILLLPAPGFALNWLPLMIAVMTRNVLSDHFGVSGIAIKWPNDLWLNGKKLGGVLCEGVQATGHSFVVAGLGVNCRHVPPGLESIATSLAHEAKIEIPLERFCAELIRKITEGTRELSDQDIQQTRADYERCTVLKAGDLITFKDFEGLHSAEVIGLGQNADLVVKSSTNKTHHLIAEEVTLVRGKTL